jgi:hypothetical protein
MNDMNEYTYERPNIIQIALKDYREGGSALKRIIFRFMPAFHRLIFNADFLKYASERIYKHTSL